MSSSVLVFCLCVVASFMRGLDEGISERFEGSKFHFFHRLNHFFPAIEKVSEITGLKKGPLEGLVTKDETVTIYFFSCIKTTII